MELQNFDSASFLREYWQKRPLFIKNSWREWSNPLAPEELAGLACEEGVEARLISENVQGQASHWSMQHGPFDETIFPQLGNERWTLLVQAVDQYIPQVHALIGPFRFIPDWRIDDVMVSFAADKGGVGPHFDNYDVFLIQGAGKRKWQVGAVCDNDTALKPHDDLRQLAEFQPADEWICEAGDILYIPPGVSHNGVAIGDDCMTYSIGFRAPSRSDLLTHFCDFLLDNMEDDVRYPDPDLNQQSNAGEIDSAAIEKLHMMITESLSDRDRFAQWFGRYSTEPKYGDLPQADDTAISPKKIAQYITNKTVFSRNISSRFSYVEHMDGIVSLFVDGHCIKCNGKEAVLAKQICREHNNAFEEKLANSQASLELLAKLVCLGSLVLSEA